MPRRSGPQKRTEDLQNLYIREVFFNTTETASKLEPLYFGRTGGTQAQTVSRVGREQAQMNTGITGEYAFRRDHGELRGIQMKALAGEFHIALLGAPQIEEGTVIPPGQIDVLYRCV